MASLGDLTLFVSAETNRAQRDIQNLGREADKAVETKREFNFSIDKAQNSIRDFKRNIESIGKVAQAAYKVAKFEGVFDDEIESAELLAKKTKQVGVALNDARKPGELLRSTFDNVRRSVTGIVSALAKVGFALYGIQQIVGVLNQAFGSTFNNTVGRAVRLQESILKTQTALASTNDIFRNGELITDPYESIVSLTGEIAERIESIRERSLDLAGVTSSEVIEVFSIVASQAGQINASLVEAEDLAIKFAAALGTFGLPIYQARQEIGSIFRGDIGPDAYLAKSLGITGPDIARARNEVGGLVAFINKKLEPAVAGQAIAARSFSGVASNIADFKELFEEAFGKPLVQPLIDGLTVVYDLLVSIKDAALGGASALGSSLGNALSTVGGLVAARATQSQSQQTDPSAQLTRSIDNLTARADAFVAKTQDTLSSFVLLVGKSLKSLARGFSDLGAAFVGLNIKVLQTLLETLTNMLYIFQPLIEVTADFVSLYGDLLRMPVVQLFANITAQLQLMERLGVNAVIKLALVSLTLIKSFGTLKAITISLVATIKAALVSALQLAASGLAALQALLVPVVATLGAANPAITAFAANLTKTAASAQAAATGLKTAAGAATLLTKATVKFLKFNIILLAVTVAVAALIEVFNKFRRDLAEAEKIREFDDNIQALNTNLSKTAVEGDAAASALRSVAKAESLAAVNLLKQKFIETANEVAKLKEEIEKLQKQAENEVNASPLIGSADLLRDLQRRLKLAQAELHRNKLNYTKAESDFEALESKDRLKDEITTQSKDRDKLEAEMARRREQYNEAIRRREFSALQDLAKKRIDLFRAEESLRIRQLEKRNEKLIEGEEGASAAALQAFNQYLVQKERGELDLEAQKRELTLANADVEEQIANYKYDLEQKILELKKKGLKILTAEAELAKKKEEAEKAKIDLAEIEGEQTAIPSAADLGLASADGFASARRRAQAVSAQILSQQALTQGFINQSNLDEIVTRLLPNRPLEASFDSIEQASALLKQLGNDLPIDEARINAETIATNNIMQREITQTLIHLKTALSQQPEVYEYLKNKIYDAYNGEGGILKQLYAEAAFRKLNNQTQKEIESASSLRTSMQQGQLQTSQALISGRAGLEAALTNDPRLIRRIQAQASIDSRRLAEEDKLGGPLSGAALTQFKSFAAGELANADRLAELDILSQKFEKIKTVAEGAGNAIASSFTDGFTAILTGAASIQDVLGNLFTEIARTFQKMAQKMIADMIRVFVVKKLVGLFNLGGSSGIPMSSEASVDAIDQATLFDGHGNYLGGGLPEFANGGIVTRPTTALIGEGGMNEAVVPLPNGKAIPVDFKKGAGGDVNTSITVNVEQSGNMTTQMSGDNANKLGKAIDKAIKRVIIEEKRAGGMLYSGRY